ncbi:hypothetical protein HY988_04255 [Candidatus Micrarchaeota archaeon]|nr:hypothetical protein [Candidatus Micrarchaeota archaeon]
MSIMVSAQVSGTQKARAEEGQGQISALGKKGIEVGVPKPAMEHMARGLSPGDKKLARDCIGAVNGAAKGKETKK